MNVLITTVEDNDPGGIANYMANLKNRFLVNAVYAKGGRRVDEKGILRTLRRLMLDYAGFIRLLKKAKPDLVHINMSLNAKGVLRDSVFIILSTISGKKTLVHFHGWDKSFEKKLKGVFFWLFKRIYQPCGAFIVLAEDFKSRLKEWGFTQPIFAESTLVDDALISGFEIEAGIENRIREKEKKVLFLARIIKEKGIYETVDAVALLHQRYPDISLMVGGDGDERPKVSDYIQKNGIRNVVFAGYVTGEKKKQLFRQAYLYCLPSYQEGMPTSLLEAMSFGLPVITQPVGGIVDFFENGENGYIPERREPESIAKYLEKLILEVDSYREISLRNYRLAQERYLASQGVKRIERIYHLLYEAGAH